MLYAIRVYPRVYGGTRDYEAAFVTPLGLSPRVRGNPCYDRLAGGRPGSIPACAGEPRGATTETPTVWVYPRVCGGT